MASPAVQVGRARIGTGLFATRSFASGERVMHIEGRVVNADVLWKRRGSRFSANCIRFGPETYLDPGESPGRFVNHSCAPNTAIHKSNNRLYLVAARRIAAGTELTFDYSTTIGDDDIWTMRCRCDARGCRRVIRNFGALPASVRARYRRRGMVPQYVVRTLDEP